MSVALDVLANVGHVRKQHPPEPPGTVGCSIAARKCEAGAGACPRSGRPREDVACLSSICAC